MPTTRRGLSSASIEQLIAQRVVDAIAAYEANQSSGNGTQNESSGSAGEVEHTAHGTFPSEVCYVHLAERCTDLVELLCKNNWTVCCLWKNLRRTKEDDDGGALSVDQDSRSNLHKARFDDQAAKDADNKIK
ncbi:hypothetical protein Tco_1367801 [Tanacetum coccineum]